MRPKNEASRYIEAARRFYALLRAQSVMTTSDKFVDDAARALTADSSEGGDAVGVGFTGLSLAGRMLVSDYPGATADFEAMQQRVAHTDSETMGFSLGVGFARLATTPGDDANAVEAAGEFMATHIGEIDRAHVAGVLHEAFGTILAAYQLHQLKGRYGWQP